MLGVSGGVWTEGGFTVALNGRKRNVTNTQIWGKQNELLIMMATVRHVTSGSGLRKFKAA